MFDVIIKKLFILKNFFILKNHVLHVAWVILDSCGFLLILLLLLAEITYRGLDEERPVVSEMGSYAVFLIL